VITRRTALVALTAAIGAPGWCFAAAAPLPKRIGFLYVADESTYLPLIAVFRQEMQGLGYVEGKDYALEYRSARGDVKQLPVLANELIAHGANLLITAGTPNTRAARDATRSLPIVMVTTSDPVGAGLIASLAHPGGNVTGVANLTSEIAVKRLEFLREILPSVHRVGFVHNPESLSDALEFKLLAAGGGKLGVRVIATAFPADSDAAPIFETLKRDKVDAIMVTSGANLGRRAAIVEQANKHRLPSVFGQTSFVTDGGLICYTADWPDQYRRAAMYVDRIFKGAKPGDLPVEQPTKFELVINMKTAKALGLKIPQSILVRADRVIE
jgi:putative tryptophan/tyrosine transport system substrate-binding protein